MSLLGIGVLLGLAAAFLQSVTYLISGAYVRRSGNEGWTLVAPQLLLLMPIYGVLAWVTRPDSFGEALVPFLVSAAVCMVAGYAGNVGLFQMQKSADPSQTGTLQGLKIPFIALFSFLFTGQHYTILQLAGVALVVLSVAIASWTGRRISASCWGWLVFGVIGYALSDIAIGRMLSLVRGGGMGMLKSSFYVVGVAYLSCGILAIPSFVGQCVRRRVPAAGLWFRYALPYGLVWLAAMLFLFVSFSLCGVLLGAIAQSTRSVMSVFLGWVLSRRGYADVETATAWGVYIRRTIAAVLLVAAIAVYLWK